MNARFRTPIVALCVVALLAGCGSVTQGIAFQAPTGWTGTPAMFGRLQMWMKSGKEKNTTQMLMLVKGDSKNMQADLSSLPPQYGKDLKVLKRGDTKLCGGTQPAQQFVAQGADKDGHRSQIEMTSTVIGNDRYVAMYIRPLTVSPDAQAEAAIVSLCPTK